MNIHVRGTRVVVIAIAMLVLMPTTGWAHPFVRGGEAPVDSLAELTLAMAHGCGTEQAGGGDPTLEVAMEAPEGVRIVGAEAPAGWSVEFEDGPPDVVIWTAGEARDPAPELMFQAVFSGEPGDEVYLKVFQGCEDFSYRWVGTPDEPASDPAIRVRLIEADPSAPPPEPSTDEATEPEDEAERAEDPELADEAEPADEADVNDGPAGEHPEPEVVDVDTEDLDVVTLLIVALGVGALGGGLWWIQSASRRRR